MKTMNSIAAILSMTYPSFARMRLNKNTAFGRLENSEKTVAEYFSQAGYSTFRVSHNFARVFERLVYGFNQGFKTNRLVCTSDKALDCDAEILSLATAAVDEAASAQKKFFGWVFFSSPHFPYLPHYKDMPAKTEMEKFRQEIRFSDEHIGKLIDHLKEKDLWKNTIVIVMGDHGEELEEHGKKYHNSIYSECTHVAMTVYIPGVEGRLMSQPTSTLYVFPWLFQTGKPMFAQAAIRRMKSDFGPVLKGTEGAVISEILGKERTEIGLTRGDYRFYFDMASNFYELYNLKKDPREMDDIYDESTPLSIRYRTYMDHYLKVRADRLKVVYHEETDEPRARPKVPKKTRKPLEAQIRR